MDITKEDVNAILGKLDEIEKEVSALKLMSSETNGQMKGKAELIKLELEHMEREQKLKEEKLEAQLALINVEVQRNKKQIEILYNADRKHDVVVTKVNVLFVILGFLAPGIIFAIIQGVLIWGKVKGF